MLMMLNRNLYEAQLLIQMQDYRLDALVGFDLHGKTIGVIGTGKIGLAFAQIIHGFGCKLLAYDPVENPKAKNSAVEYTSLEVLLKDSDVISLNCPLNKQTKYMIDAPQLAIMKQGAIIINTARGAVINTGALITYLENGHLGGACLDVYEKEKGLFFYDHRNTVLQDDIYARLCSFKNVLLTGHQASLTNEALQGIAAVTIANLDAWAKRETSENEVT
jgi:D-lactate dehydrogenase